MTWLWRICFSALFVLSAAGADITGAVRISHSQLPAVQQGRDYSGVVVWLEPLGAARPPSAPARAARYEMLQKDKRFTPHVLAVPVGAEVRFPNLDPIFHSAFSNFSGQIFDFGLYAPGTSRTVSFTRPGVVRVFCNIHPTMSAVIVVLKDPWFAVSDRTGAFVIRGAPAGDYTLHAFHERATEETLRALAQRVAVSDRDLALGTVAISEIGYLPEPHKNKYGADYPPDSDAQGYSHGHK